MDAYPHRPSSFGSWALILHYLTCNCSEEKIKGKCVSSTGWWFQESKSFMSGSHIHLSLPICSAVVIVFFLLTVWAEKTYLGKHWIPFPFCFPLLVSLCLSCSSKDEFAVGLFVPAGSRPEADSSFFPCRTNMALEPGFNARGPEHRSVPSLDSRESLGLGYLCGKDGRCRQESNNAASERWWTILADSSERSFLLWSVREMSNPQASLCSSSRCCAFSQ